MNESHLIIIAKLLSEGLLFVIITIILFNEFAQVLKTMNLFTEKSINLIGIISLLLATDNLLSKKFLNVNIFK